MARVYRGDQALEVVRLAGAIIAAYDAIQAAHPGLPFSGYFALGVCNDANALIELAMQGETSLYPLTRDTTLFPADTEVGSLARRLPVDGRPGEPTDARRVLATLPVDDLAALPLPDLRRDLEAVSAAYGAGTLQRGQPGSAWFRVAIGGVQLWRYRNALLAGLPGRRLVCGPDPVPERGALVDHRHEPGGVEVDVGEGGEHAVDDEGGRLPVQPDTALGKCHLIRLAMQKFGISEKTIQVENNRANHNQTSAQNILLKFGVNFTCGQGRAFLETIA